MKMVSLKKPCNQITKSLLCPQHTKATVICIGALVRQRDGDTSVIWIVDIVFCSANNKNSKVVNSKMEHKRHCNDGK